MQPKNYFRVYVAAILTFQVHELWRRFLRILTSKDKGPSSLDSLYTYKAKILKNIHFDITFETLAHLHLDKLGNPKEMRCF